MMFLGGHNMTDWPNSDEPRHSVSARLMDRSRAWLNELLGWDLFKWMVIALLTANCLLIGSLLSRIGSEVEALQRDRTQDRTTNAQANSDTRTTVGKDIASARAGLAQTISEMTSGLEEEIAKANAKLDALVESSRKPSEKPHR
jgi:hypothetical protein